MPQLEYVNFQASQALELHVCVCVCSALLKDIYTETRGCRYFIMMLVSL